MHSHNNQTLPYLRKTISYSANTSNRQTSPQRCLMIFQKFETLFKDRNFHVENTNHWFKVKFLIVSDPAVHDILEITTLETDNKLMKEILTEKEIILWIEPLTLKNDRSRELIAAHKHPVLMKSKRGNGSVLLARMASCTTRTELTFPTTTWSEHRSWKVDTSKSWMDTLNTQSCCCLSSAASRAFQSSRPINIEAFLE